MATEEDVLNVARSLIGVHETPMGSNIVHPITDWARQYGYSTGDAWCAWTVSYEVWHVDPALLDGMAPTGYSGAFRAWGELHGRIIPNPQPGAIDVMNFDSDPSFTDHLGIVESVHSGYWTDIEGNHKDQDMRQDRSHADGQHWFVLPLYSTTSQPKEDDVGIAQTEKKISAGEWWRTMGFGNPDMHGYMFLGLINEGSKTAHVTITMQYGAGDFGTKKLDVPISSGNPRSLGLQVPEIGQLFGNPNLGNYLLWVTADQPITIVKTQSLVV